MARPPRTRSPIRRTDLHKLGYQPTSLFIWAEIGTNSERMSFQKNIIPRIRKHNPQ